MKVHLLDSDDPLRAGGDLVALCGQTVTKSRFAFLWDEAEMGERIQRLPGTCRKCAEILGVLAGRYVYGIVSSRPEDAGEVDGEDLMGSSFSRKAAEKVGNCGAVKTLRVGSGAHRKTSTAVGEGSK